MTTYGYQYTLSTPRRYIMALTVTPGLPMSWGRLISDILWAARCSLPGLDLQ